MTIVLALLIVTIIGFIAQRIGLCMVKATNQALGGDLNLLVAILMSGSWLWVYFIVSAHFGWQVAVPRYSFHYIFLLGGFIFGIGAGINQACSVSTMNRFTKGELSMMFTMVGWAIGWCIWIPQSMASNWHIEFYSQLPQLPNPVIVMLFIPTLAITLQRLVFKPDQRKLWFGILAFGLLATVLFLLQPNWPPSKLIQDTGSAIFASDQYDLPAMQCYALVMAMLVGMWLAGLFGEQFEFCKATISKAIRHTAAGGLMGLGGAAALGGNDTHLLMGLPTLSFASVAALTGMVLGIATEQWAYRKFSIWR